MLEGFNFQEVLILLLLGTLFFKEQLWGLISDRFGREEEEEEGEEVPAWAERLIGYYNHDTTDSQTKILDGLSELKSFQLEHNRLESDNNKKLDEILKYGVPCRPKTQ